MRVIGSFLFTFACIFIGLTLPWASFGATYSRAFSAVANGVIDVLPSHSRLEFHLDGATERPRALELGTESWRTTLTITNQRTTQTYRAPLDLRGAHYVPAAAFIALTVALPVANRRRKVVILAIGLAILLPLSLILVSLPLIPRLRGGQFELFPLPEAINLLVGLFYRAFVAHPGMAYAIPALMWWILVSLTAPDSSVIHWLRRFSSERKGGAGRRLQQRLRKTSARVKAEWLVVLVVGCGARVRSAEPRGVGPVFPPSGREAGTD